MPKKNRISNVEDVKHQLYEVKTEVKDGIFVFTNKMSIVDFASKIQQNANEIVKKFFLKGKMYPINHVLEEEEIAELCVEFGLDFRKESNIDASNFLSAVEFLDDEKNLTPRPPIVTVMGHVDHGKTTLIDKIRKTNVAQTESSGITQHTGAYQIVYKDKKITFIDTPGHEAFSEMRSRGAKITDIIILVVAADDGVMPQTKEAIKHAKKADVPMIVFVNKMDKKNVDLDRIKGELAENDVLIEEYGGDTQIVYGSALTEKGIDQLFDAINILAEILNLRANRNRYPIGTVIESRIDKGIGPVSTLIVENGTLYKGDFIVAGSCCGRIRTLTDSTGKTLERAHPGAPVVVSGLNNSPLAGDRFIGFQDEKFAKKIASAKESADKKERLLGTTQTINLNDDHKIINVIIKSDVQGTAEAIKNKIHGLANDEASVNVIAASAGQITNNDLLVAQASKAIIFGFNIKPTPSIKQAAKQAKIDLIVHDVIYNIIEAVELILEGEKAPVYEERKIGSAHIIKIFKYSKVGNIAGCLVDEGIVKSTARVKLFRGKKMIHTGFLDSLRRDINDVKEVEKGKDFGCHFKRFEDIALDDVLEFFEDVRVDIPVNNTVSTTKNNNKGKK
ncbi:translation initiation factor IF-2 [Mycoplasmopsis hyopharyngis]|uniref:translation initiation factor IF-2 n=1 Tax=Mycoplasmopsis hyopharyngis TaxID=29558 RepID=UPI003872E10B